MHTLSRREFLRVSTLATAATIVAACTQPSELTAAPDALPVQDAPPAQDSTPAPPPSGPPARYGEAPMLAELVQRGELPPVEERLPEDPYVDEGEDGIGNYGGTWRRAFWGISDGGAYNYVINRSLWEFNRNLDLVPHMLSSWEVGDGGREWTLHLRKGIKWSDGAPLTSEDFRFKYEDVWLNDELTQAYQWGFYSDMPDGTRVPAEFSAPDAYTLRFKFALPSGLFHMCDYNRSVFWADPAHYMKQFHKDYADKAQLDAMVKEDSLADWTQLYSNHNNRDRNPDRPTIYAWILRNSITEEFIVAERNPYFWEVDTAGNQLPYIDKITLREFKDKQVCVMWAVNGEIDQQSRHLEDFREYPVLKGGEAQGDYKVHVYKSPRVASAWPNLTTRDPRVRELFNERNFRIALSLCINRDEMRDIVLDGLGRNSQYVPPPESPLYYPKLAEAYLDYDPDRANTLLDDLGYIERDADGYRRWKDGSGERMVLTCLSWGGEGAPLELLSVQYLKDIGIQMNVKTVDRSLANDMHWSNEVELTVDMGLYNLMPLADPQLWVKFKTIHSRNWCVAWSIWYSEPDHPQAEKPPEGHWIWDIWDAWARLQQTSDSEEQKHLFWQILDIWAEELPAQGFFGDYPIPAVCKNGFMGIHPEKVLWDCCATEYEYHLNSSTFYWDEPDQHTL